MADVTITPANVAAQAGSHSITQVAGEDVEAGDVVYDQFGTGLLLANNQDVDARNACGIVSHGATTGNVATYVCSGPIYLGPGLLDQGKIYVLSGNDGMMAPSSDLATGWVTVGLGYAISTDTLFVRIYNSDTEVP